MSRRLLLFDDRIARRWHPFALTMPVGEILFGALKLRERIERYTGLSATGYAAGPGLEDFVARDAPPAVDLAAGGGSDEILLLSTRYVPPLSIGGPGRFPACPDREIAQLVVGDRTVGWWIPVGTDLTDTSAPWDHEVDREESETPGSAPAFLAGSARVELPGMVLEHPWELVALNEERLAEDLRTLYPDGAGEGARPLPASPGVERVGAAPVSMGDRVEVDPGVVLDTRDGPIHLASGVRVRPFSHIAGPALIGRDSTVLGGRLETSCCGPVCNLRGEIAHSIILGYANKAHDGYLGYSLLGHWVNLGAMTTNSDLKNNYGSIRMGSPSGPVDTGRLKLGVFLGDHVKTGIGTTLDAGTVIGAGTNVFGRGSIPRYVPAFRWGTGQDWDTHRLEAFLETADRMMRRRGRNLEPAESAFLSRVWRSVNNQPDGSAT